MLDFIKTFRADEDGAVTADWVVLTAAIAGLGIGVLLAVQSGTVAVANDVGSTLSSAEIPPLTIE